MQPSSNVQDITAGKERELNGGKMTTVVDAPLNPNKQTNKRALNLLETFKRMGG